MRGQHDYDHPVDYIDVAELEDEAVAALEDPFDAKFPQDNSEKMRVQASRNDIEYIAVDLTNDALEVAKTSHNPGEVYRLVMENDQFALAEDFSAHTSAGERQRTLQYHLLVEEQLFQRDKEQHRPKIWHQEIRNLEEKKETLEWLLENSDRFRQQARQNNEDSGDDMVPANPSHYTTAKPDGFRRE